MFNIIIITSFLIQTTQANILDLFFSVEPPLKQKVDLSKKEILDQSFRVKKSCSYQFELRLIHEKSGMNIYKDLYPNKILPIELNLQVFKISDIKEKMIFDEKIKPKRNASAMELTKFLLAHIRLEKGKYKVKISTNHEMKKLKNYNFYFMIGIKPKTSCD